MSTENKTPRELLLFFSTHLNVALVRKPGEKWEGDVNGQPSTNWLRFREVLPETDGVWVSREDWGLIKKLFVRAFYSEGIDLMERIERGGGK